MSYALDSNLLIRSIEENHHQQDEALDAINKLVGRGEDVFLLPQFLYEFWVVATVQPRRNDDRIFEHKVEPVGRYVLEHGGEVLATGGFALHYNPPFADLYMEVRPDSRQRGYGSFLLQEVKKECYLAGRVPAARCHIENKASRATLIKAGMKV